MVLSIPKIRGFFTQAVVCVGFCAASFAEEAEGRGMFQVPSEEHSLRRAAVVVGSSEPSNLALVRELQLWRRRALEAGVRLENAGTVSDSGAEAKSDSIIPDRPRFEVVGVLASDRVIVLSSGRDSGIFEGALLRLESGAVAKVIEARRGCCAAVLENSFRGNISGLEGQKGQVVVR
jgi:hypothetical protein